MSLKAAITAIAAILPLFPEIDWDITCGNMNIPKTVVHDNARNISYTEYSPTFTKITDGLPGSEGPIFDTKRNFYAVTVFETASNGSEGGRIFQDGYGGKLYKIDLKTGEKTIACSPWVNNFGGRPCGCQSDKKDNIWIADLRLGLLKYTPGGECVQVSTVDTDGNPLSGLDDLIFDTEGNLWITGPGTPIAPEPEDVHKAITENIGVLYYLGKGETIPKKIPNEYFRFCNGIVVRGNLLLVSETMTRKIIGYDITGPGRLENRRVWAVMSGGYDPQAIAGPDGMDFDVKGRLLVTHSGDSHIEVYSPDGRLESRIKCPFTKPSNIQFDAGTCTVYVTDHEVHSLWKFDWDCKGMPMYSDLP